MDVDSGFGDLLQQAQQLTADMDTGMELPRVERNLQQLKEAAQRMASRVPLVAQETTDVKAWAFLQKWSPSTSWRVYLSKIGCHCSLDVI